MLKQRRARGFTLLEVLVALFVLTIGLLGVLKLETVAYASTNIAAKRSIAALEAASLAASMHVNRGYWTSPDPSGGTIAINGNVVTVTANAPQLGGVIGAAQDCTSASVTVPCLPLVMAAYDLQRWAANLQLLLPNVFGSVNCGTAPPVSCMINIQWNENAVALNAQETGALASPSYTLYVEP
jgi:type IV pilus assembly protein PilV